MPTTTERRIDRLERGSKRGATLAAKADVRAAIEEIRHISQQPHIDNGANTGEEIQARAEIKASLAAQTYKAPDDAKADSHQWDEIDARRVPVSMLLDDLRRRTKRNRDTRGFSKDERLDIATDALLLIQQWSTQGAIAPINLGARGQLPLRRDWLDPEKRTVIRAGKSTRQAASAKADRAMRAAIKQAARNMNGDAEHTLANPDNLVSLDGTSEDFETDSGETIAAQAARIAAAKAEFVPSLPDTDAPDILMSAMGIGRSAARKLIADMWQLSARQCSDQWDVSVSRAENIFSEGKREIRKRYPDAAELLDALRAAETTAREQLATRAYLRISDYAQRRYWEDARELETAAQNAVNEWRASMRELPMERRAIELAAQRIGWQPEHISASAHVLRYIARLEELATTGAAITEHGSHLCGAQDSASAMPLRVTFNPCAPINPLQRFNDAAAQEHNAIRGPVDWITYRDKRGNVHQVGGCAQPMPRRSAHHYA